MPSTKLKSIARRMAKLRGPGVNPRSQARQWYRRTVSSFFRRRPLVAIFGLPQYGQRSGGLTGEGGGLDRIARVGEQPGELRNRECPRAVAPRPAAIRQDGTRLGKQRAAAGYIQAE